MKVLLSGYEGSKKIIPASAYLASKYLKGFDIYFLNYGDYKGALFGCNYIRLKDRQENGSQDWSKDISEYLETLEDERLIFALDDYFLESDIDLKLFETIKDLDYVNLCAESVNNTDIFHVTTQYTLWNRDLLIEILREVKTPWQFEIEGSVYFNKMGLKWRCVPCLSYPANSSLSERWEGVKTYGRTIKYL